MLANWLRKGPCSAVGRAASTLVAMSMMALAAARSCDRYAASVERSDAAVGQAASPVRDCATEPSEISADVSAGAAVGRWRYAESSDLAIEIRDAAAVGVDAGVGVEVEVCARACDVRARMVVRIVVVVGKCIVVVCIVYSV